MYLKTKKITQMTWILDGKLSSNFSQDGLDGKMITTGQNNVINVDKKVETSSVTIIDEEKWICLAANKTKMK